jgi:hypothetical protein
MTKNYRKLTREELSKIGEEDYRVVIEYKNDFIKICRDHKSTDIKTILYYDDENKELEKNEVNFIKYNLEFFPKKYDRKRCIEVFTIGDDSAQHYKRLSEVDTELVQIYNEVVEEERNLLTKRLKRYYKRYHKNIHCIGYWAER